MSKWGSLTISRLNKFKTVALDSLQFWINKERLDPERVISLKELYASGCLKSLSDQVW